MAWAESFYNLNLLALLSGIAKRVGEIVASTTSISSLVSKILDPVNSLQNTIEIKRSIR